MSYPAILSNYRGHDYLIRVIPVKPPVGVFKFGADISILARVGHGKAVRLSPDIGEALGRTEEEAYTTFEAKLKQWIDLH
jgi:hypothetical protein